MLSTGKIIIVVWLSCKQDNFSNQVSMLVLSSEFGQRCRVQGRARHWLQLVGCAALLMDASNFGGPDGVGESGVKLRRSLRKTRTS